jgi:hypothetical protein
MPRKTRRPKLRVGDEAELRAWQMAFKCGHDYLSSLKVYGLTTEPEVLEAMPDAWRRLGAEFMGWWDSRPRSHEPYAFLEFGEL